MLQSLSMPSCYRIWINRNMKGHVESQGTVKRKRHSSGMEHCLYHVPLSMGGMPAYAQAHLPSQLTPASLCFSAFPPAGTFPAFPTEQKTVGRMPAKEGSRTTTLPPWLWAPKATTPLPLWLWVPKATVPLPPWLWEPKATTPLPPWPWAPKVTTGDADVVVGTQGLTFCSCDCWANASWIFSLNNSFSVSRTSRSLWCYKEKHLRYCYGSDHHPGGTETVCTQVTRAGKPPFILEILLLSSSARHMAQALAYKWRHTDQSIGTWNAAHVEKALFKTLGTTSLTDSFSWLSRILSYKYTVGLPILLWIKQSQRVLKTHLCFSYKFLQPGSR